MHLVFLNGLEEDIKQFFVVFGDKIHLFKNLLIDFVNRYSKFFILSSIGIFDGIYLYSSVLNAQMSLTQGKLLTTHVIPPSEKVP